MLITIARQRNLKTAATLLTLLSIFLAFPFPNQKFLAYNGTNASASPTAKVQANVVVSIDSNAVYQAIDGFGTCLAGNEAEQPWWQDLYYNDLKASILRVDLTPQFVSPYSDFTYNSPWFHNSPGLPGPENNNVRTYTSPSDYSRAYAGRNAPIAVMKADATQNLSFFDYVNGAHTAGTTAQIGNSRRAQLGDFKLIGSLWSPVPWVKVSSGNTYGGSPWPLPVGGAPYPFIWAGNFVGGRLDVSNTPLPIFNDGAQNTSSLTQFARSTASYILGYQRSYNVHFYAISIQNELNFETFYSSMTYPHSAQYVAALKAVRAEFNNYDELRDIRIMGPEDLLSGDPWGLWEYGGGTTHKNLQYVRNVQNDSQAATAMDFFNIHGYAGNGVSSSGAVPTQWNWWANGWTTSIAPGLPDNVQGFRYYGKKSWMTETSGEDTTWLSPSTGFPGNGAWSIALKINQALTFGQESGWLYWQMTDGGNVRNETLTDNTLRGSSPKYVALKHFARFIRPRAVRVAANITGSDALSASAYIHSVDKTLTTVLVNASASSQTVTVQLPSFPAGITQLSGYTSSDNNLWQASNVAVSNNTATVTVPGYGVTTLYGVSSAGQTPGSGTGLRGEYFDNADLTNPKLTRVDSTVDFNWGTGSPDPSIGSDTFSARWTGQIEAPTSGIYTFSTTSDDGIRLWVNNQLLINNWAAPTNASNTRRIKLARGQLYDIRLEYNDQTGNAVVRLLWRLPIGLKPFQAIPQSNLYP
ncbi:MAG: PA14 domain-containing protein [Pyrinomonadaceae bacterium]